MIVLSDVERKYLIYDKLYSKRR